MLTKEQLRPLLDLGYTQQKIADELKCSRADVHYYLTKYKLSTSRNSPHKKKLNEEEFKQLKSLVDKGLNNVEIGKVISKHRDIVRKYLNLYGIKRKIKIVHPNLIRDYFKIINTKEKAYWLGFLYADGFVHKSGGLTVLDLAEKDKKWVTKFCNTIGVSVNRIKQRIHKKGYKSVSIRIYSREFTQYLIIQGCVNAKSKIIRLPKFDSYELDMAFLMGYYDGDGTASGSSLCSGSLEFLEDIKCYHSISAPIKKHGTVYYLYLGIEFKRKLISSFPNGMDRKK